MILTHNRWIVAVAAAALLFFGILGGAAGLSVDRWRDEYHIKVHSNLGTGVIAGVLLVGFVTAARSQVYPWERPAGRMFLLALAVSLAAMLRIGGVNGNAFLRMYGGSESIPMPE